jgi:hypothetical protein
VPRGLEDYIVGLPGEEQARIAARAASLLADVDALATLRERLVAAQETVKAHLQAGPASVQKMERRVDLYVGALREALHAVGGELEIVVRLPGHSPMSLMGFEGLLGSR